MLTKIMKNADLLLLAGMMLILMLMMVPMPPALLDMMLTFNIAFSLAILLVSMYSKRALDFSSFPSVLLIVTLGRLALNVASTRLILMHGYAGQVILTFGEFVVGGNYIVGLVIFIILVVIQFVVITNGAGRVAEVSARFTLDAMPGKQMSIDADLAAGCINQAEAQLKRKEIAQEADFYGAMDGAGKFVKGDAIAAVVIMIVNVVGGLIVGVTQQGLPLGVAVSKYTLLTIGEGLVGQISALLVSTATGLIVTRAASDNNLGQDVTSQFLLQPMAMTRITYLLVGISLIPGLPKLPFWIMAATIYMIGRSPVEKAATPPPPGAGGDAPAAADAPEDMVPLLDLEPVELEIGYALVELVDAAQGGDLLHRVVQVRRSCATELGVLVPPVRIRDNLQLRPGQYRVRVYGQTVGEGECMSHRVLAMTAGAELSGRVQGIAVKDPVFGLAAMWINPSQREQVELAGVTVVEPSAVIATHLSELLRNHAPELLGRQDVQGLVDHLRDKCPKLVDDVIPNRVSLTQLRRVMQNLLRERISVRDLRTILETLADYSGADTDAAWLTEKVRESLARAILQDLMAGESSLRVVALAPSLEASLEQALPGGKGLDPKRLASIAARIAKAAANMAQQGWNPVVVSSQRVRPLVRRLTQRHIPTLVALSYEELLSDITIDTVGVVQDEVQA